jgi:integrase
MPRLVHRVPVARLHRPSGQARVRIAGRDHYLGPWRSPEAEQRYREIIAAWLGGRLDPQADGAPPPPRHDLVVAEAASRYQRYVEARYKGRSTANIRLAVRALVRLYADLPMAELGPATIKRVRESMVASGLTRNVVMERMVKLRQFLKWCSSEELLRPEQVHRCRDIPPLAPDEGRTNAPRRPVEWETVERTLPHLTEQARASVLLLWFTGARPGELASLTTSMIDRSGDVWQAHLKRHKTAWKGKDRTIYFGPKAQAFLEPWLRPDEPDVPILPYHRVSLPQAIRRACKKAGVDPWVPYQLRHAAATRIRDQFDVEAAAKVLGHARLAMIDRYSHTAEGKAVEALRIVG